MRENKKDMQTRLVPGVGRMPYPAYRGKEPYVFISYARLDSERVFAEIKRFNEAGFHVWYDEGIAPGNEWSDEIAEALSNCSFFVVMLTPTSAPREAVLNEISFALDEGKPLLAIYLEETVLPPGLKLRISRKQAILRYNMSEEEYEYKYIEAFTRFGLKRDHMQSADTPAANETGSASAKNDKPDPVKANVDPAAKSGEGVSIRQLDELAKSFLETNKPVNQKETAETGEEFYDDSPEDAIKRANGDLVRIDGFDIEHGFLRGYKGTDKDIIVPSSAGVIGSLAFSGQTFLESVDLNQAGLMIAGNLGVFCNCPNLKTVKIPATVKEVTPNMFQYCPNLTVYVRRNQVSQDFEERFTGKGIVYLDE